VESSYCNTQYKQEVTHVGIFSQFLKKAYQHHHFIRWTLQSMYHLFPLEYSDKPASETIYTYIFW
jgi:hypothetical protein